MDFYIKKNSTLPKLYMEFAQTGYATDVAADLDLENADIVFSMRDTDTCVDKVKCAPARVVEYNRCADGDCKKYLIEFSFTERHTKKTGTYQGEFQITFGDGQILIAPVWDKLLIHVLG